MKHMSAEPRQDRVAEQERLIARQQQIAAALHRSGQTEKARIARGKLLALLNQLDLMQALGLRGASTPRRNAH
jgi:hypothetical protein